MKILVGSQAVKHHFPDFREPHDTDYFANVPVEGEAFYQPALENYWRWKSADEKIATPDELYTIKVSHSFWELRNGTWSKHMHDVAWLKDKGCRLDRELYDILYPIWEERYGVKKANLNKTPEEFFTNTVVRTYDHDSIHRSVAYYDEPLFNEILRDGASVAVSKDKFFNLPFEKKCQLVREECYATALERILIPSDYMRSHRAAYNWALRKTITSFSKGWFPLWIVENYAAVKVPDIDFVKKHMENSDRLILLEA